VRDRRTGTTSLVSVFGTGEQANHDSHSPAISADGRYVAFLAWPLNPPVDPDTDDLRDAFVRDRWTGTTSLMSVSGTGEPANSNSYFPAISADGRYVTFVSWASNLVPGDTNDTDDVFVHDRRTGTTSRVSVSGTGEQATGDSRDPAISADGRYVAFGSAASNLVPGDTNDAADVFVRDRVG
jgi:Tol biopolymer transport system component